MTKRKLNYVECKCVLISLAHVNTLSQQVYIHMKRPQHIDKTRTIISHTFHRNQSILFLVLCGILMTACDVSAIAKPWDVQHRVAKMVADEFFDQGDLEKSQLNTQPVAMMDR